MLSKIYFEWVVKVALSQIHKINYVFNFQGAESRTSQTHVLPFKGTIKVSTALGNPDIHNGISL